MTRLAIILLSLALTACEHRYTWHLGDSTAYHLNVALPTAHGGMVLNVLTFPGAALGTDGATFVNRLAFAAEHAGTPRWLVVQLGTNDLFNYVVDTGGFDGAVDAEVDTSEELDGAVAMLLAAVPTATRVLWVMPGPGVAQERRAYLRAALERSPRPVHVLELPPELYVDGIHFIGNETAAAQVIVGEMERLDGEVEP